jgi:hypothetical protein
MPGNTTTVVGPDLINNSGARGVVVVLVTTSTGTGSETLVIEGKDSASATYSTLLSGAAVTTNTTNRYWVFPGAVVTANVSANDQIPEIFRIRLVSNNANPVTCTLGGTTLV